jgi:hypothetical protein
LISTVVESPVLTLRTIRFSLGCISAGKYVDASACTWPFSIILSGDYFEESETMQRFLGSEMQERQRPIE